MILHLINLYLFYFDYFFIIYQYWVKAIFINQNFENFYVKRVYKISIILWKLLNSLSFINIFIVKDNFDIVIY